MPGAGGQESVCLKGVYNVVPRVGSVFAGDRVEEAEAYTTTAASSKVSYAYFAGY